LASTVVEPLRRLFWIREEPRPRVRRRFLSYLQPLGLLLLVALGVAAWADMINGNRHVLAGVVWLIAAGSVLPVAVSIRRPLLGWRIVFVMIFIGGFVGRQYGSLPWNVVQVLGFLFVLARVSITQEPAITVWATVLSLVPIVAWTLDDSGGVLSVVVAVAALGDILYRRRRTRQMLAEHEEITERERGRRALLEERARIAREMHDVVAHHMSMIAVRAETAPYRVPGLGDNAQNELATIATAARAALTDMRRLLGALRAEDGETPTAPQPGISDISDLVRTARAAGVDVTLHLVAVPDVPETVGLTAYRILQEALANAARHAPGGPVRIEGRGFPGRLELTVRNKRTTTAGPGGGHGLIGMRERAALLGGELTAGPDRFDFVVSATLPFDEKEAGG
jgi:signal transduction histidine kinase